MVNISQLKMIYGEHKWHMIISQPEITHGGHG